LSGRVVTHWIDLHRAKAQKRGAKAQKKEPMRKKTPGRKKRKRPAVKNVSVGLFFGLHLSAGLLGLRLMKSIGETV
jgi:hypothetical protein